MTELEELTKLLVELDTLLDSYQPGEFDPNRILGEVFAERAKQRPLLERVVQLATDGLQRYPFNAELLQRRALARSLIVTPHMEYPELALAADDLRAILTLEPYHLSAGFDLLEILFIFNGMENEEIANVAEDFGTRTERLLIKYRALQIRALVYAGKRDQAEQIYAHWTGMFPDSESWKLAKEVIDDDFLQ